VEPKKEKKAILGVFEKYLTLWIALFIVTGLLLGRVPEFRNSLKSLEVAQQSIPIGICLFFMMYPTVVGIRFSDVKSAVKKPKPLLLTIIANWVIAPAIMTLYANLMLKGNQDYIIGVILLGMSPCTAMVMWWIMLAKGELAQGLVNTAVNAMLMILLYAPMSAFYIGVSGISVPWELIAISVIFFIALPVSLGALSRRLLISRKGEEWFKETYLATVRRISIIALLLTLIVMFSLKGDVILSDPLLVAFIAAPNLLHYVTMIAMTYSISWLANWNYETSIVTTLIGSSSHFEVAIAVATTAFPDRPGAALATVIGPLMEVPLMLSLTKFGLWTKRYFPRKERIMAKVVHVKTWDEFKHLVTIHQPNTIAYTLQRAPLSNPPIGLRLVFASKDVQYVFLDVAEGKCLKRTRIPVAINSIGEFYLEEEDIKNFLRTELKRTSLSIISMEALGY